LEQDLENHGYNIILLAGRPLARAKMSRLRLISIAIIIIFFLSVFVVIFVDAKQITGVTLNKISDNKYEAVLKDKTYKIYYVAKEVIIPTFGEAFLDGHALIREDLPQKSRDFVTRHEIYHLYDFINKPNRGRFVREIHANLAAFYYEPIGGLQTLFLTLTNPERIKYYLKLII
jgi:hypothetical protein